MRTSESIAALAPALVKAQAQCGAAIKDKTGKIETRSGSKYEYNYADFASVVEIIKPALAEHGLAMIQWSERHDDGITVVTRVQHTTGEWQETDTFIPVAIVSAQAVGSALTYGKRYGAQALMFMASADDDAKAATDNAPAPKAKPISAAPEFRQLPPKEEPRELTQEERDSLRNHAAQMTRTHEAKGDVKAYYEAQRFDDAQRMALWLYLPPAVRAALKAAPTPLELGSQP